MSAGQRSLDSTPGLLDRAAIRRQFDRASSRYDESAVLAAQIRGQMIERLDWIDFSPETVLDLGCGTGHGAAALAALWPRGRIIALDSSPGMLRETNRLDEEARIERLCAEAESLPLNDASVDLVFSNVMLPWCEDIDAVFAEVARVLKPRGLFTFTTFGPDTLMELRSGLARGRRRCRTFIHSPTCMTSATGSFAPGLPSRYST